LADAAAADAANSDAEHLLRARKERRRNGVVKK
jgi:hypothetical protein